VAGAVRRDEGRRCHGVEGARGENARLKRMVAGSLIASGRSGCGARRASGCRSGGVTVSGWAIPRCRRSGSGHSDPITYRPSISSSTRPRTGTSEAAQRLSTSSLVRRWRSSAAGGSTPITPSACSTASCASAGPHRRSSAATTGPS
jgi:hypothetical protein